MAMASVVITIAKRSNSSLLCRLSGKAFGLNHTIYSYGYRSIHQHHRSGSHLFALAMATDATFQSSIAIATPESTTLNCNILQVNSALSPLGTTIRLFGRKGSRMGHHIQNLEEMAHSDSREEAKHRREEKKKNSKKSRLSSKKDISKDNILEEDDTAVGVGGGGSDGDFGPKEDEFGNPLLPNQKAVRSNMLMVVASLERSFSSLRGGEATPELFDSVRVSTYGETMSLGSVGQTVIEDPQRATISCYDPSVAADVRDAIRDIPGMNLNPYIEEGGSGVVIIPIPRASEESRTEIVKELFRMSENGKQRINKIRRGAMDIINKGKQGKLEGISKDDAFRVGKEVDSVQKDVLAVLKDIVEKKQKSVMED